MLRCNSHHTHKATRRGGKGNLRHSRQTPSLNIHFSHPWMAMAETGRHSAMFAILSGAISWGISQPFKNLSVLL